MDYKKIKKEAKANIKRNYFKNVIVVFICTILIAGGIRFSSKNILDVDLSKPKNIEILQNLEGKTNIEIIDELLEKTVEEKEHEKETQNKYTKGVFAIIINEATATKSVLFSLIDSVNKIFGGKVSIAINIIIANGVFLIIKTFFIEVFEIGKNRYYLEKRRYTKTDIDKILYPYKKKKTFHLSIILLLKNIYLDLWKFTIVGWFIKAYEYSMIPYILAENPNIKTKEAFKLSKEMTDGQKFELFKLDLSILCWKILGLFTFNMSNIFFTNVYKEELLSEVYANLRAEKYEQLSLKELLNDDKLFVQDVVYEKYPEEVIHSKIFKIDINKEYGLTSYVLFFFTFSFVGYLYEVVIFLIKNGKFINRGMLYGPWLPIYGFGGIAIVFFLKKFRKDPFQMFLASFILCGIIEYGTAWFLETFKNVKYWDYTGHFMNLHGRICLEALIVFGLGGCGFTYIAAPLLDNIYSKINYNVKSCVCVILLVIFAIDEFYVSWVKPNSGEGITENSKVNISVEEEVKHYLI